jgi:hypothetical protein
VFPGHCSFVKRVGEWRECKRMVSQVMGQILEQRYALELMSSSVVDFQKTVNLIEVNTNTYQMIQSIEYTLNRQRDLETLSDDQETLIEKIDVLKASFNGIIIILGSERK